MRRRRFLAATVAGSLVGLAGCAAAGGEERTEADGPGATAGPTDTRPGSEGGPLRNPDLPLGDDDLLRAAGRDDIPAISSPAFAADWSSVSATLGPDEPIVGVAVDGTARAYPLAVLNWHEVVNDDLGGPLLVTYCPLCGSGVVADRLVAGRPATFGVSGYLWHRDLVLYDARTESLWSQLLARAVRGPRTGDRLALRPSALTTWREWRREHPDTSVLLPPPASETVTGRGEWNYDVDPYAEFSSWSPVAVGINSGPALGPKELVLGVATDRQATAYPLGRVLEAGGVVNDTVGDLPVVVASTRDALVAYDRRVGGETLHFGRTDDGRTDGGQTDDVLTGGGSRWGLASGCALDGPHEGTVLRRANDRTPMYWFAWASFYPGTAVYGRTR